jgi:hypothetical protein
MRHQPGSGNEKEAAPIAGRKGRRVLVAGEGPRDWSALILSRKEGMRFFF